MHSIDVFSEIYARTVMQGRVIGATTIGRRKPLCLDEAGLSGVYIHVVQEGACRRHVDGRKPGAMLVPGEVVAVTTARSHRIELLEQSGGFLAENSANVCNSKRHQPPRGNTT
ncbi:hypothetical protein [Paraburkholderia caffeinitolerans]|uniref:hypothetical protein n=1 Tax=Paraburkholderia caffeinitolerans TaxID=1723730 RepID=UPI001583F6D8|nr:hypothetical protein [Paraburkholderia caffeinitolerans]